MPTDLLTLTASLPFAEELYRTFLDNPSAVDPSWRTLFEQVSQAPPLTGGNGHAVVPTAAPASSTDAVRLARVFALVAAYRVRGHLAAHLDPLEQVPPASHRDRD